MSAPINGVEIVAGSDGSARPADGDLWPPATATGLGPMPGRDIDEAVRVVVGELPELPFLPQLPDRGVGADPVGATVALLVDIWAAVVPSGWRVSSRPTRDVQRGKDFLAWDCDALERHVHAQWLKVQVCGPLTLAALLELPKGNRVLTDTGALRDLTSSLAEGLSAHVAELARRMQGAQIVVQLDEPRLPDVLAGRLPTASGFGSVAALEPVAATELLATVLTAPGVHHPILDAGAAFGRVASLLPVAGAVVDFRRLGRSAAELDPIGEWLTQGRTVLAGAAASQPPSGPATPLAVEANVIREPLHALGFDARTIATQVIPTPSGDLSEAPAGWPARALRLCRDIGRLLADDAGMPT